MDRRFVLLLALALGAAAALANAPGSGPASRELLRALVWALAFVVLLGRRAPATRDAALGVLVVAALALHVDFGRLRGGGRALHHHELYNYYVGSKYFDELGYDGHYLATHRALIENDPSLFEEIAAVKNLRTYRLEGRAASLQRSESVSARFDEARWRELRRDVAYFQRVIPRGEWRFLVTDHGYNATPFWTLIGGAVAAGVDLGPGALPLLASLDLLLLAAAVALAAYGFGRRGALCFALFYLASTYGTFEFTGGAFLRMIWLVGAIGFAACLRRGRHVWAGALLAVAAADRVFPALLLLAPLATLARALAERRVDRGALACLASFAASFALLAGAAAARYGTLAWVECIRNLTAHSAYYFTNQISLRTLFLVEPLEAWRLARSGWDEARWLRSREARDAATAGTLWAVRALLVSLVAWRAVRRGKAAGSPVRPVGLACLLPFVLLYPANYYFALLAVGVAAVEHDRATALALVLVQAPGALLSALLEGPLLLELESYGASLLLLGALGWVLLREAAAAGRLRAVGLAALAAVAAGAGIDLARAALPRDGLALDLEAARLDVAPGAAAWNQSTTVWGSAWSRDDQVAVAARGAPARARVAFELERAGSYDLFLALTAAPPHGPAALALDGTALGTFDLASPQPRVRVAAFPGLDLKAGAHALELASPGGDRGLGVDRVDLEPALARRDAQAALARALAWVRAHPADLFDGGRKDVALEITVLGRLLEAPALADERGALERELGRRVAFLNAAATDWLLAPEAEVLAAAHAAARRAGLALAVAERNAGDLADLARSPYSERGVLVPAAVAAWLAQPDAAGAGGSPAPAVPPLASALAANADALAALVAPPYDPTAGPRVAKLAADVARELCARTDLGRARDDALPLPPAELAALLDGVLRYALSTGDVATATRVALAARCVGLEDPAVALGDVTELLLRLQRADGSFGPLDAFAPNPEREVVLLALLLLAI